MAQNTVPRRPFPFKRLTLALAACFATAGVQALPTGAQIVNGTAPMTQVGQTMTITNSNGAIINWESFSIGKGETVRFVQASTSSVLNRVVGKNLLSGPVRSEIFGQLLSDGRVFLINPAGILVGAGAVIDVGSFVASSLQISDADFLARRFQFQPTTGAGLVRNEGIIQTPYGGKVYLIAPQVENAGTIKAAGGEVLLLAGRTVQIGDTATPGLQVEVTGSDTQATNMGTILADAGRIGVVGALVKNSGTLSASSAVAEGGRVFLRATRNVEQTAAGRIEANGTKGGTIDVEAADTVLVDGVVAATGSAGKGGSVRLLGDKVGLVGNAAVDASGSAGGGTVLVGGDYQGKNPDVRNASFTWFGADATVKADATASGDGGKVIFWADDATRAYGKISARGGAQGGNGGFVEVSGKKYLDFHAYTDIRSPKGTAGTLLLDPADLSITSGSGIANGSFDASRMFSSSAAGSVVGWDDIVSQLLLGNVVITSTGTTNGNISIDGSPTALAAGSAVISHTGSSGNTWSTDHSGWAYNSGNSLSFLATNNIYVNSSFANAGSGAIKMVAGWDGASTSTPAVAAGVGSIYINDAGNGAVIGNVSGAIDLQAGNTIRLKGGSAMGGTNKVAGIDMGIGALKVKAINIEVLAGAMGGYSDVGNRAFIQTNGSQTFDVLSGGHLWVKGGGNVGDPGDYGNEAWIGAHGSGSQTINVGAGGSVLVQGGNGTGADYSGNDGCPTSGTPACSNNRAEIRVEGTGSQTIAFAGGGTLDVTGGTTSAGFGGNSAEIGAETGTQTISGGAAINITSGGGSGGFYLAGKNHSNEAGIFSEGTQNISGSSLDLDASAVTASGIGGAFLVGRNQNINISGNISLSGGLSNVASERNLSAAAVIGYDNPSTINITAGGAFNMTAGSGTYGGALVGTVQGTSNVSITAQGIAFGGSTGAWAGIGAQDGSAANIHLTATSGGGINLQTRSEMLAGSGQIVMDHNVVGGASVSQAATSRIVANRLEVNGKNSITLTGSDNRINTVALQTVNGGISYSSNSGTVHVEKAVITGIGNVSLGVSASGNNIALGRVETSSSNTVNVAAKGAILDDNGSGVSNIKAGTITMSTVSGGNPGGIAVSADVDAPAGSVTVTVPVAAGDGGISIRSVGTSAPTSVSLSDATTTGNGDVFFSHNGDLNTVGSYGLSSQSGSALVYATGNLTYNGGVFSGPQGTALVAGGNLSFPGGFSGSNDMALIAGNSIIVNGMVTNLGAGNAYVQAPILTLGSLGEIKSNSLHVSADTVNLNNGLLQALSIDMAAGQLNVTGGTIQALQGDVAVNVLGNINMAGGLISAGNNVKLALRGADSTLYLNPLAGSPSKVVSGANVATPGGAIKVDFQGRTAGGVVIDGMETLVTGTGSGFYNGATPAVRDAGLFVNYGVMPQIIQSITKDLLPPPPPPPPSADTSSTSVITASKGTVDSGFGSSTAATVAGVEEFGGGTTTTSGGSSSPGNSQTASKDGKDGKSDGKPQQSKSKQRRNMCT